VRIAIIGGTFDPIHNGHLAAAESVASTFQVDEVHFVPAFSPPHKQSAEITSPFHRFAMVALATMPFERFRPSTIEVDAFEKRYSVDTLELMRRNDPGAELLFVIGTDMFQEIHKWKDYRRLFELAHIVVINRPGFPLRHDLMPLQIVRANEPVVVLPEKNSVFYLPFVEQPISSTEIRKSIGARDGIGVPTPWVPPQVWSYIEKNHLYS
jgi:nicotinate-nucleotide adenylyltransferase